MKTTYFSIFVFTYLIFSIGTQGYSSTVDLKDISSLFPNTMVNEPKEASQNLNELTITTEPEDSDVCLDGPSELAVAIEGGVGIINFQWQSSSDLASWTDIPGATTFVYSAPTSLTGTTYYQLIISDDMGVVTSNIATVVVHPQLFIVVQPTDEAVPPGTSANLNVGVSGGTGTITYQWQSATDPFGPFIHIAGATNSFYETVALSEPQYYQVVVEASGGGCEEVVSDVVIIEEQSIPVSIVDQPIGGSLCVGGLIDLSVTATGGSGNFEYQWQSSSSDSGPWIDIAAAQNSSFQVPSNADGMTYYRVEVNDANGSGSTTTSDPALVIVYSDPTVDIALDQMDLCMGGVATFTGSITGGSGSFSYQWQKSLTGTAGWSNISGANSLVYNLFANQVGTNFYRLSVTDNENGCNDPLSMAIPVTVSPNLNILTQPQDISVCKGCDAALMIELNGGGGALSYQWQSSVDGSPPWTDISGATSNSYDPPTTTVGKVYYRLMVTASGNACQGVISNAAEVDVFEACSSFPFDLGVNYQNNELEFSWADVGAYECFLLIKRLSGSSTGPTTNWVVKNVDANTPTSFTEDENYFIEDAEYKYRVKCKCLTGSPVSPWSDYYYFTFLKNIGPLRVGNTSPAHQMSYKLSVDVINIYPNPVSDQLNIILPELKTFRPILRLVDLRGRTLKSLTTTSEDRHIQIPVNDLQSGMYFLHVQMGEALQMYKVIVD